MTKIKFIISILCLSGLVFCQAPTTAASENEAIELPKLFTDSVTNQLKVFDYSSKIKPVVPEIGSLEKFKGQNLFIFFFSVNCGHCKRAAPHIEKLAMEMETDSLHFVAIATSSSPEKKIPEFIKTKGLTIPVFHDYKRDFSNNYGTGFVPVILLINKNGNFFRIRSFSENKTPSIIKSLFQNQAYFQGN